MAVQTKSPNPSKRVSKGVIISITSVVIVFIISSCSYFFLYWVYPSIDLPNTIYCGGIKTSDRMTQICNTVRADKYTCSKILPGLADVAQACYLKK